MASEAERARRSMGTPKCPLNREAYSQPDKPVAKVEEPTMATHLLDWLSGAYDHCKYGSRKWCEGYLRNAVDELSRLSAENAELREDALNPDKGMWTFWNDKARELAAKNVIAERNRDAARANFITMQQSAAKLLEDCEAYKASDQSNLARALAAEARVSEAVEVLTKISCPTQTEGLLWWQVAARQFLDTQGGGNGQADDG